MAEVSISINGRIYEISCDAGQESRVVDLASYIDQKLQKIARSGAAYNDAHLLVLTALVLADELFEAHTPQQTQAVVPVSQETQASGISKDDEKALLGLLEKMTKRIDGIAARVQAA